MKVLALETATSTGSIAILDDRDGLVAETRVNITIAHSERLMSTVQWLLQASQVTMDDLDAFAVSIGPGSFTGLRIGLSTVKGFCYATGRPLVPVPTLDAFSRVLSFCGHQICPMFDAKKNEVYTGLYRWEKGSMKKIMPEVSIQPDDLFRRITEPTVFLGEGARVYEKLIRDRLREHALFAPPSKMSPAASTVAEIAVEKIRSGDYADPVSLTPLYIRKSEAELRWKK
ncbi:MAG: tRNA (adenosine(37)-N6)-threonylcarbamoyltransferase complex dimerization subunit type 1 TsaB [Deltaproteobacteria bacterium]|nr:tRNA (adenosine(37)-N6)-threonylcarbamoyltransferase complex dimerization subunit type 1 TsaB [Deltaproteobacteria bacterium]